MITEKDTYSKEEVKQILANIIDSFGYDAGAICKWSGVNAITVDEWKTALFNMINEHHEYGKRQAFYTISCLIDDEIDLQRNKNRV